ncbi:penicillin-binding protein activator [Massilia sp. 2TAF26]|uniref:penicillin-binding protein activator n=1 Tax=Massilia sp. 2TAF26 TaxID=3233012 RepID=UPI003F9A94C7
MLIKKLKALGAGLATGLTVALLTGCTTVSLDEPQRLCAPGGANTSPRSGDYACPEYAPPPAPAYVPPPREVESAPVQTAPIQLPGHESRPPPPAAARGAGPVRVALLLPMNSPSLGAAADAVRAGFMASAERDGAGIAVDLVATGDSADDALAAYSRAAASHDVIVGPLARPAVSALASGGAVSLPTVALNHPEVRGSLPRGMVVAGLSLEDEARQAADWAAREHPQGRALILTGNAAWAQRAAGAFEARWSELGHTGQRYNLPSAGGRADPLAISELKTRLEIDPPEVLFAALDAVELRQVRARTGTAIPLYTGGAGNPGRAPGTAYSELNGLRVVDLPWLIRPDNPAVMVYPRPIDSEQSLTMSRLYALGIDAFLVARELGLRPGSPFIIDGVTGHLEVDAGSQRLRRREAMAVYRDGNFEPADAGP